MIRCLCIFPNAYFLPITIVYSYFTSIAVFRHVCLCEGVRSPGARATEGCELACGCWEVYPAPLEEQQVLLTSEPFLQAPTNVSLLNHRELLK